VDQKNVDPKKRLKKVDKSSEKKIKKSGKNIRKKD
jgi:hypothetical protein